MLPLGGQGRVAVVLDFDGVVNATRPPWSEVPRRRYVRISSGHEFRLVWAPGLRKEIKALGEHPKVQVAWLTSWGPEIHRATEVLGLPEFPSLIDTVLPTPEDVAEAKRSVIAWIARSGQPYVWCDDEHAANTAAPTEFGPRLEIKPKEKLGLTPDDIESIWDFAIGAPTVPVDQGER